MIRGERTIDVTAAVDHDEPLQVERDDRRARRPSSCHRARSSSSRSPAAPTTAATGTCTRRGAPASARPSSSPSEGSSFVACDYLGGGDSSRPDDGDFIGLEVQADAAHGVFVSSP